MEEKVKNLLKKLQQLIRILRNILLRKKVIRNFSRALSFTMGFLFITNYWMAEYIYPFYGWEGSCDLNIAFRYNCYSLICFCAFCLALMNKENICKIFLSFGFGLTASDVVDRLFFDKTIFDWKDCVMIAFTGLITAYEYNKGRSSGYKSQA